MKKIFSIILLAIISVYYSNFSFSANSVVVSAVVGNLNHSPVVINVLPDSNPKLLKRNALQNYTLYFKDNERDIIYFTITPQDGYTNPISGTINTSNYDSGSGAYINFAYLAPSTNVGNSSVNIVLNDGPNVISKNINLYIY